MKKCPYCGAQLQENARFCLFCMRSLENKVDVAPSQPTRGRWWLWLLVCLCVSALLIGIAVLFQSRGSVDNEDTTGGTGNTTQAEEQTVEQTEEQTLTQTETTTAAHEEVTDEAAPDASVHTPPAKAPGSTPTTAVPDGTTAAATAPEKTEPSATTAAQAPTTCNHSFSQASCMTPMTCTLCGETNGYAAGHNYTAATCTTPQTCTVCGVTTGDLVGHTWKDATCTEPATCTVCKKTSGQAAGHSMLMTKCQLCDHTDFSVIAKTYTDITAYDAKTGEDYEVTNVSIDASGVLRFSFKGNNYTLTLKQVSGDRWEVKFNCYNNGLQETDASVRVSTSVNGSYFLHVKWEYLEGCKLYFNSKV